MFGSFLLSLGLGDSCQVYSGSGRSGACDQARRIQASGGICTDDRLRRPWQGGGISVDVREMRDSKNATVRGLLVDVTESEYRQERSFVDADEIPELLKGFDALLEVKANPTQFKNFEVRYTTRGELQLTAFNANRGAVLYAVQAGRGVKAQKVGLRAQDMQTLRGLFGAASQKLTSLGR
jgi:hypothetical protein